MKLLLIPAMCLVLLGCQSPTPTAKSPEPQTGVGQDKNRDLSSLDSVAGREHAANPTFIGVVKGGTFRILSPKTALAGSIRFTSIGMQQAVPPESGELDLTEYEGSAIAIQGHDGGGWVYSARVIDKGGPIVTALVLQGFGR